MKLVNMAIGGEPVSTLYEASDALKDRGPARQAIPQIAPAIGQLPVYTADGIPIPLAQVATIEVRDDQATSHDRDGQRQPDEEPLRHCRPSIKTSGSQERLRREIRLPTGFRVQWFMFADQSTAPTSTS